VYDHLGYFEHVLMGMLGGIVTYPASRRENKGRGIGSKGIEKAERTEIHTALQIDRTGKSDWAGSHSSEHKVMKGRY
jgi:hypothetical protein